MPTFTYDALDAQGKTSRGSLAADSRAAALDQLSSRGLIPVALRDGNGTSKINGNGSAAAHAAPTPSTGSRLTLFGNRVPPAQVEAFTRELANLLEAGVPLAKGLSILRREVTHATARQQWTAIHDDVIGGKPLAEALARWPASFPPVYIAMIRAGEMGGFLETVFTQIADFRSREAELKGKVKAALVYPAVLACVAVGVIILLLTFFIPTFQGIFKDLGGSLPLLTRGIIAASTLLTRYGLVVLVVVLGLGVAINRALKSDAGRRFYERALLATPGLGVLLARFALVRFARMLGTLLGAGVPLVTALRVAQEAIGNQTLADAVAHATDEVKRGAPLSRSLGASRRLFPGSVVEMVAVAEESGRLDKELLRLGQTYEKELDRRLRMLVSLAEPLLLFIMAALIGTIVIGMLLPIFTMQDLVK